MHAEESFMMKSQGQRLPVYHAQTAAESTECLGFFKEQWKSLLHHLLLAILMVSFTRRSSNAILSLENTW